MENQVTAQKETESKGKFGKILRTVFIALALAVLVITFVMAFYRKFSG